MQPLERLLPATTIRAAALLSVAISASLAPVALADVIILTNRSSAPVKFSVAAGAAPGRAYQLGVGDLVPIACRANDRVRVAFLSAGGRREYLLHPNSVYFFYRAEKSERLDLEQIALDKNAYLESPADRASQITGAGSPPSGLTGPPPLAKVKVKILVDDGEKAVRAIWERRLRNRVAAASTILEKYAAVALEVVACETWVMSREVNDFDQALAEFERVVKPDPADVAIGFFASRATSGKYRSHGGSMRVPLATHVLLPEWSTNVSESERLELLVHELGHHFGATHSPEPTSVMRPLLGDRKTLGAICELSSTRSTRWPCTG